MIEVGVVLAYTLLASGVAQDIQPSVDLPTRIEQIAKEFTAAATWIIGIVNTSMIQISRVAYISIVLIGVLLYSTHLAKRLGKDLIQGGLVLAILSEIIFPLITRV